jgi:diguanylate cyclase (GGDEF)-like protein
MIVLLLIFLVACLLIAFGGFMYVSNLKKEFDQELEKERQRLREAENTISALKEKLLEQEETNKALNESREKLRRAVYHDILTGLPRKELFLENIKLSIERKRVNPLSADFAVVILNLGGFGDTNESSGNIYGDKLIRRVSERVRELTKIGDFLARLNGSRFGLILNNMNEKEAKDFANLAILKLKKPYKIDGNEVTIKPILGISLCKENHLRAEDLIKEAEIALQEAKESGKGYAIFDSSMQERILKLQQFELELRNALEKKEFEPYFQPIVSMQSLTLVGFEVLIRWRHPKRGLVMPGEFISFCEKNGLIEPMTYWILAQACKKLFYWQDLMPDLTISVNLSSVHFSEKSLYDEVERVIYESRIPPGSLKLEITESTIMEDAEKAIEILEKFKKLGTKISIDDFGTGYSSLSYLHRFPVDTLKIDRSFINGMERETQNSAIAYTIITLAKSLRLSVVAEGVENIAQLYKLREFGCDMGQGYLFAPPLPADKAEKLLQYKINWQNLMAELAELQKLTQSEEKTSARKQRGAKLVTKPIETTTESTRNITSETTRNTSELSEKFTGIEKATETSGKATGKTAIHLPQQTSKSEETTKKNIDSVLDSDKDEIIVDESIIRILDWDL